MEPEFDMKLSNVSHPQNQYNVVSVDKNCHSCTNPQAIVLSAFKMACLSYNPSNVNHNNSLYRREDLHEWKLYKVNKLISKVKKMVPWKQEGENKTTIDQNLQTYEEDSHSEIALNEMTTEGQDVINIEMNQSENSRLSSHMNSFSKLNNLTKKTTYNKNSDNIFTNCNIKNKTMNKFICKLTVFIVSE